ncbi:type VI secretion system baseplate subunit TssF [Belnapia sp. T6]|uniref:Type VI secretion system baseplate subunit TssF n=1 Tax=Belnapia mucosa TaxID=2804532 RepID=A0ABS1VAI7_9PROT|nr:type VI secretion system baseplate subunit TssF [Belnapia mucosa]MBL6458652.1 type VI secretion system baseplate subunit TssF [Belnapia mucosa]
MIKDPRFLRYYEQELRFLRDLGGEFASEHARVANRFGLDADTCADPHVEWLLDGCAFLAARVQQKLDGDYAVLTQHLLEMIYPDYLAPTPATGIAVLELAPDAPPLEQGFTLPRGSRLQSRLLPEEGSRCVFTTAQAVTTWPIEITEASYLAPAALAARGLGAAAGRARAGLLLRLRTRHGIPLAGLALDRLTLHLAGRDRVAQLLYEALIGHSSGLVGWLEDTRGGTPLALDGRVSRVGFAEDEALFPPSPRGFSGFRLLREYFTLPDRFLFVALDGLQPLLRRAGAGTAAELVVLLDRFEPALEGAVTRDRFALFATPVVNLFHRRATPIQVEPNEEQHHLVVDRSHPLDHEVFAVTGVQGFGAEGREACTLGPFYAVAARDRSAPAGYFTLERRPRLLGEREHRLRAARSTYLGSEAWLELCNAEGGPLRRDLKRLDVEVLATNRDLPLRLPLPAGAIHLTPDDGGPLAGARILGTLTAPRPSPAAVEPRGGIWGEVAWRLIGHLALNYHSLVEGPGDRGADALRGLLELYAGAAGAPQLVRHAEAVRGVAARAVTGRLPGGGPITFGRGLEVTLELAEAPFQDGSAFVLGGVLEAFLRRHVALNSFVETVLRTSERGEIMRWPSHTGSRHLA